MKEQSNTIPTRRFEISREGFRSATPSLVRSETFLRLLETWLSRLL